MRDLNETAPDRSVGQAREKRKCPPTNASVSATLAKLNILTGSRLAPEPDHIPQNTMPRPFLARTLSLPENYLLFHVPGLPLQG